MCRDVSNNQVTAQALLGSHLCQPQLPLYAPTQPLWTLHVEPLKQLLIVTATPCVMHQVMPRGMVCWAGGTGGPHWFVNVSADSTLHCPELQRGLAWWLALECCGSAAADRLSAQPALPQL